MYNITLDWGEVMKKLLVCDFDDTVRTSNNYITYLNFNAIKKFRNNGGKLVFASGRDYNSLKFELVKYNCPYDGLICNDGSVGFDSKDQIVFSNTFKDYEMNDLLYYIEHSCKKLIYNYDLYDIFGYTNTRENIIQLSILSKLLKKKQKIVEEINNFFPNLKVNKFNYRIHIRKNCNKSDGIKEINKIFNIKEENIYTIGDWKNDYEMIRDYNGYNVLISHPSLYKVSKETVFNTAQLVKKLENK